MAEHAAVETLDEIEAIRQRTRSALEWGWAAFFVFGIATLVSALFTRIDGGDHLGEYWLVAAPVACLILLGMVRRMEYERGVLDRAEALYALVIGGMVALAVVVGYAADGLASEVGPVFPIAIGLLVIAGIDRSRLVALTAALLLALGVALAVIGPSHADTWLAVGEGLVLMGAGVLARPRDPR